MHVKKLKMRALDNVLRENNIKNVDLIKMDVQGAELLVLKGAPKTVKNA